MCKFKRFYVFTYNLCRELGVHGFLVEGILVTDQAVSIPYQYLVYSSKKATYEYEYIDFTHPTRRRSLCVKTNLLDDEGRSFVEFLQLFSIAVAAFNWNT